MKITKRQLQSIIQGALCDRKLISESIGFSPMKSRVDAEFAALIKGIITEEEEVDVDYDPANAKTKLSAPMKKLLDPDITPQKFAKFDAELDKRGTSTQKAQALAGFALTYVGNESKEAIQILQKAIQQVPKMAPPASTESGDIEK